MVSVGGFLEREMMTRVTFGFDIEGEDTAMRAMGMALGVHLSAAVERANAIASEPSHVKVIGPVKIVHWELVKIGEPK